MKKLLYYTFLSSLAQSIYRIVFNLFLRDLGFNNTFISHITSLEMIGSAFLGLLIGIMGDKFGKKIMLIFSSVTFAAITFLRISIPSETMLIYTALINGGVLTSRMILLNSLIVDITTHENRGKYFGYNFGLFMGSGLIGNLIGGSIGEVFGFSAALLITGITHLFSNFFLLLVHEDKKHHSEVSIKEIFSLKDFDELQSHIVKIHLIRTFLIGFGAGLFVNFGNVIFKDLFNMQPTIIGVALAFAQLGASLGSIFSSKLSKKFGAYQFTLFLNILVIPLIISFAYIRDPYLFTVLYALRFSFMNMTNPVSTTIIMSYIPQNKITTISSFRNFLNFISRSLAALIFGYITSFTNGYTYLFLISALFYFISLILLKFLFKPILNDKIFMSLYKKNI
ncbi:MFS transporter [Marinitoga sp. 1155]|uniref:MFS transporter n=1 Tax=Marinitoga sp. 1155 TaxID=1428448 RepID=UPI000640DBB5|nr:MFS transporter [Marinitoga sp. 1155]KLO22330.1 arabinose ABC transporter permease [Marinitoga sp. 1155]